MANKSAILSVRIVSDSKRFRAGMKQAESTISKFNKSIGKTAKISAVTAVLANLGSAALAGASNFHALTASLVPVAGAAIPLVGIFAGFVVGLTAMIMALKDAPKVLGDLSNKFGELQNAVSTAFWKSAEKPIRSLITTTLPALTTGLTNVGSSLGKFFGELATSIKNAASDSSLKRLFDETRKSIDIASQGLSALVDGIKAIGGVGIQYLSPLAQLFTDLSTRFGAWAERVAADGSLQRWTEQGLTVLTQLGGVLSGLVGIFGAVATAAGAAGGAGVGDLAVKLQRIADIMNAEPFQGALVTIFTAAHQAMATLSTALAPLGGLFVALAPVIAQVLTTAAEMTATVVSGLAPGLAGLAPLISSVVSLFASLTPIVAMVVGIVSQLAIFIGQNSTLFMTLASAILGAMAAVSAIRAVLIAYNAVMGIVKTVQIAVTTAMAAYRAGLTLATAAQIGLNTAQLANPMTLIIVAVLALVAGIIYLATQTQFFQKIWAAMVQFVTAATAKVTAWVISAWSKVSSWWSGFIAGIKGLWSGFTSAIQSLIAAAISVVTSKIQQIRSTVDNVISGARSLFDSGFNFMRDVAKSAIDGVLGFIGSIAGAVRGAIDWVKQLFSFEMPGWMKGVFGGGMTGSDFTGHLSLIPAGEFGTGATGAGFPLSTFSSGRVENNITNVNITVETGVGDPIAIGREIEKIMNRYKKHTGAR